MIRAGQGCPEGAEKIGTIFVALTRPADQETACEKGLMATLVINPFLAHGVVRECGRLLTRTQLAMVVSGMELRMSERSEHYDIHTEFQVPRMVNRSC